MLGEEIEADPGASRRHHYPPHLADGSRSVKLMASSGGRVVMAVEEAAFLPYASELRIMHCDRAGKSKHLDARHAVPGKPSTAKKAIIQTCAQNFAYRQLRKGAA